MNDPRQPRRVVVTGLGVIAPNGLDLESFWSRVRLGVTSGGPLTRFDPGDMPARIAAEVAGFQGRDYMRSKTAKRLDRATQFGIAAAGSALRDSSLDTAAIDPDRIGLVEGTSLGGMESALKGQEALTERHYRAINPCSLINGYSGSGSGEIALELGLKGHAVTLCSSSASGNDAIGYGADMIRSDEVDVMVAGGNEAPLLPALWAVFCLTGVMTRENQRPREAMRPFDRHRSGFLLGEGAGYLVMEELGHALGRGARIYAEILGHGRSCEAYNSVSQHPEGVGLVRAIEKAMRRARLTSSEIDYVNAHGTATESNDRVEARAIKTFFGRHAARLPVSSTKPVTGHLLGASGAVESVICALAISRGEIPPTANLVEPDVECDLDHVRGSPRPYPVRHALNLSIGFGGKNSCLVLGAYRPGR